jgi:hypothetical protein
MWLFVTAAVLTACGDSRPQKCQRLESDFAEARQAWLDARAEVSDLSSQRGGNRLLIRGGRDGGLAYRVETRQNELFESGCVTE